MTRVMRTTAAALLLGAALAGCSSTGVPAGKPAPEISGEDQDGQPMSLSEFRGKVVLLDFWGNWCGPCRALYPHARELVQKMEGRPFAMLGVNTDGSREEFQEVMVKQKLTWRAWWDGPGGGPIAEEWKVDAFPTLYLIDHKGMIRQRWVGLPSSTSALDRAIEKLVREAEKG
jgi:thiol-disulfide isomerase/thioredoxin